MTGEGHGTLETRSALLDPDRRQRRVDSATSVPAGSTHATTNWQEAVRLEKELIRAALQGSLPPQGHSIKLFAAVDDYLKAKKATANTQRAIDFDRERLEVVKRVLGDVRFRRSPRE